MKKQTMKKIVEKEILKKWAEIEKKANKELKEWLLKYYGPRCKEYDKNCPVCQAWKIADKLMLKNKIPKKRK